VCRQTIFLLSKLFLYGYFVLYRLIKNSFNTVVLFVLKITVTIISRLKVTMTFGDACICFFVHG